MFGIESKHRINNRPISIMLFAIIVFFIGQSSSSFAQNKEIRGRIVDSDTKKELIFVNCILTKAGQGEKQIAGVAADTNGVFHFKDIKKQDMVLSISFVGYKRKDIEIKASMLKSTVLDLGDITIESTSEGLQEVEIIAVKDRIKLDADKMTMNIDKNTASSVTNAFELLKKAPGISIDNDDNLKLNGDRKSTRLNSSHL